MSLATEQLWADFSDALGRFIRARVDSDADRDDVLQEVFLRVHDRKTQLRDEERVAGWIFRIASHAIADLHRSRARGWSVPDDASAPVFVPPPSAGEVDSEKLMAQCVRPFIDDLPPHYRDALVMTELEGLTQAEAARRAGLSISGMKSRVQRGRGELRKSLEACCAVTLDARNHIVDAQANCECGGCGQS